YRGNRRERAKVGRAQHDEPTHGRARTERGARDEPAHAMRDDRYASVTVRIVLEDALRELRAQVGDALAPVEREEICVVAGGAQSQLELEVGEQDHAERPDRPRLRVGRRQRELTQATGD